MARVRVVWTLPARQDLRDLRAYIAQHLRENSRAYTQKLRDAVAKLADFPEEFVFAPDLGEPFRERIIDNDRIIYELKDGWLIVYAVLASITDPVQLALENASYDHEPLSEEELAQMQHSEKELAAGELLSWEDALAQLGIHPHTL